MKNVSVVITTIGRDSLNRAIASVKDQSVNVAEIIVVSHDYIEIPDVTFLTNPIFGNVCSSRNLGLSKVSSPYVTFLDDDDYWLPKKNEKQIMLIPEETKNFIITCKAIIESNFGRMLLPRTILNRDTEIREYLFGSLSPYPGDRFMQTSSLMLPTEFAKKISWDEKLLRHNDWDFLIQANDLGAIFYMHEEALVVVDQTSEKSVSRSTNVDLSQKFMDKHFDNFTPLQKSNFLIDVLLQTMINGKNQSKAFKISWEALRMYPSFRTKILGFTKILVRLTNVRIIFRKFYSLRVKMLFQKNPHITNFSNNRRKIW